MPEKRDISEKSDRDRVVAIGDQAMKMPGIKIGFGVDNKIIADRYIKLLKEWYPKVKVLNVGIGPHNMTYVEIMYVLGS